MMSQPPKKKKRYGNLILVAIILGLTVYFVSAGAAGGWLAENVINPVFNSDPTAVAATPESTVSPVPLESAAPTGTAQSVNLPETSGERAEEQITVNSVALYTLQAGAFADETNAKAAAAEIIARGGAGFVAYDGNLYRALIAGYTNETDAQSVKTELEAQGVVSTVFKLESGALEFKVGAEKSQIEAIKSCFALVSDTVNNMQQIIYDADKGTNVDEKIAALKTNAHTVVDNYKSVVTSNTDATNKLTAYMDSFCESLDKIPASTGITAVDFSSSLKYNIISIVVDYSTFLDELSS
jgi:hypothetical protein